MGQRPAVSVRGLRKAFVVPRVGATARERLVERLRRQPPLVLPAVDDVSFEVQAGECFGIVGRNGSGKSTLLKCLAGIYDADDGAVEVEGTLSPFVELGVGTNGELSGRDNVTVAGVMLGLTRSQVRERFDEIVGFAELEDFVELPLKNYSTGMAVRLLFSVAVGIEADVLLVDEVLAVGDAAFQEKCFDEFARLKREGRTILLVTHDMKAIERFCDRAMLLERGRVAAVGPPREIIERYHETNREHSPGSHAAPAAAPGSSGRKRRRYRPSAIESGLQRLAVVTLTLALVQFKLHYLGSVLGYLWAVMRPVMLFAVTYLVFTHVGSFDNGVPDYSVYLFSSIVLWTFFAEATSGAATSLLASQDLLRKLRFPRLAIPLAVVTRSMMNLAVNLSAVAVLVVATGVHPRVTWIEVPLLIALIVVLAAGVSVLLSALFVRYRDVGQIWTVLLQLLFFGSSVLYVVTAFPRGVEKAMVFNPLAMIFTQMRHALIDPSAPTAADVAGGAGLLVIPLVMIAVVGALGVWAFVRETPRMAEML